MSYPRPLSNGHYTTDIVFSYLTTITHTEGIYTIGFVDIQDDIILIVCSFSVGLFCLISAAVVYVLLRAEAGGVLFFTPPPLCSSGINQSVENKDRMFSLRVKR